MDELPANFGQLTVLLQPLLQNRDVQRKIGNMIINKPKNDREWYDLAKNVMEIFPRHIEERIYNRLYRSNMDETKFEICFKCNEREDNERMYVTKCPICSHDICNYCSPRKDIDEITRMMSFSERYDYRLRNKVECDTCDNCKKRERLSVCDMEGCDDHFK